MPCDRSPALSSVARASPLENGTMAATTNTPREIQSDKPPSPRRFGPLVPLVALVGMAGGAAWLWFESQPRQVAEIKPVVETGPVTIRSLDGGVSAVAEPGTSGPSPALPPYATAAPVAAADEPRQEAAVAVDQAEPQVGRFEEEIVRYEQADRESPPAPGGVVFVGASNIRMWDTLAADFAGMNVVNRGVGGCRLSELAGFAPRILNGAQPAVIVVSAGSNDIHAGASADEVLAAFRELLVTVRRDHPQCPVLCLGILPAKSRWEQRPKQEQANELLRAALAAEERVEYLDASAAFLGTDGLPAPEAFLEDDLHPSALGNARRAASMRPVLERLLEQRLAPVPAAGAEAAPAPAA